MSNIKKAKIRIVNGYRAIHKPGHRREMQGNWLGYVYEHIYIAEKMLNRPLQKDEVTHHLNGNRSDNRWSNLIVLNKAMHSRLHEWMAAGAPGVESFRENGMNSGKSKVEEPTYCKVCEETIQSFGAKKYCSNECRTYGNRKVKRPSVNQLKTDIDTMSYLAIGRKYGVSDNAIRKWAKQYNLL